MGIYANTPLKSMLRGVELRRAVAVVCALALLTIGFAHSINHFGGPVGTVAIQADVAPSDDAPDASKKAPVAVEHCHGCSMIAMTALAPSFGPTSIAADLPVRKFDGKRPHIPVVETPPPISSI